jgi:hypothetical protein
VGVLFVVKLLPRSTRGKDCGGALTRLDANDGIEVDIRFASGDGTAMGVALGERALIVAATSLPFVVKDAFDDFRCFPQIPVVEERVVERLKRVEASEGATGIIAATTTTVDNVLWAAETWGCVEVENENMQVL